MYSRRTTRYGRRATSMRTPAVPTRELPPEMLRRIDADPAFQVMTLDFQHWIVWDALSFPVRHLVMIGLYD